MELKESLQKLKPIFDAISDKLLKKKIISMYNDLDDPVNPLHENPAGTEVGKENVLISKAPAGRSKHHKYEGGLIDHIIEMFNYANHTMQYNVIHEVHGSSFDFSIQDVAISILLHDLSKAVAYKYTGKFEYIDAHFERGSITSFTMREWEAYKGETPVKTIRTGCFEYRKNFFKTMGLDQRTYWLMARYGISVSEYIFNSIMFAEGGWSDAAKKWGMEYGKLGAFLHILDMYSSQVIGRNNINYMNKSLAA